MKQSFRTTLVYAGVLVALLAFYLIYDKNLQPKHEQAEEKAKQLVTLDQKDVQWLEIERMKNRPKDDHSPAPTPVEYEKIELKRTGDDWSLLGPVKDRADSSTVKGLVSTLTTTKQERVVDEKPKDLEAYGLKTPLVKVRVRRDDKSAWEEIDLGKNTPVGFSVYAKTASADAVYKVARSLLTQIDKPVKDLRAKDIVTTPRFDVAEVDITAPKLSIVMTKGEQDNWQIARENLPADNNEWNKTLNAITDLKATDFASETGDELKKFGLEPARDKVELVNGKDKSHVTLLFGKAGDKVYAKRADKPIVYEVDKGILDKIEQPSSKYRNQQLASFNRFNVDKLSLERGKDKLELVKDKNDWLVPADPKAKIDASKVDTFLTKLQDTKLTSYATEKTKVTHPELVVRLFEKKDNAEKEKLAITFGAPKAGEVLVERSDITLPFKIKSDDFAKLNLNQKDFAKSETKPAPTPTGKTGQAKEPGAEPLQLQNLMKQPGSENHKPSEKGRS